MFVKCRSHVTSKKKIIPSYVESGVRTVLVVRDSYINSVSLLLTMVGQLSLSRDHHSSDLVASLRDILEENSLVDCIISSEGQYLKAHKLILSACSPYFQTLFREETDKYPIVLLKDIEFEYLKLIINFVYCGEVQVLDTQLNSFLEVAKFLQIKGLNASSRECSPERTFSELPGSTNIHGNESDETQVTNEIVVDVEDDDCQVIDLAGASACEVHEQPCADSAERPLMITDESTFSLALEGIKVPASQDFVRAADQEWHSRPVSPVSVTSITSVKTEQLVDGEEISGHSRTCSENENLNEHMECIDSDQVAQANDIQKLDNCPSVNANPVKEVENTSIVERNKSAGKRAKAPHSRANGKRKAQASATPAMPARREVRSRATTSAGESGDASGPVASQEEEGEGEGRRPASAPPRAHSDRRARYTCAQCNKSFEFRSWLKVHLRRHTGERPYSCPECPQMFAVAQNLKLHMATHSTRRPYKCPHCNMHFSLPSRLKSHLKVHTGVKPFKCSECGYNTAYSSDLIRHKRVHTGERPYKCPECNYAAMCSAHLSSHRRTHERAREQAQEQARLQTEAKARAAAQVANATC